MIICDACKEVVTGNVLTAFQKHYCADCTKSLTAAWDAEEQHITQVSMERNRKKVAEKLKNEVTT